MKVVTQCKNCVFEHEPLQCFVGRLEKLRNQQDCVIVEVDGHYEIEHRMCDWATPRQWSEPNLKEIALKMRENRILQIPFIIIVPKESSFENLTKTVRSLQNQQVLPQSIHLIDYSGQASKILPLKDSIPLSITSVILDDYPEKFIHQKVESFNQTYYGIMWAGDTIPSDFIRKLDQSFNDDMNHFVFLQYGKTEIHSTLLSSHLGSSYIITHDGYSYKDKIAAWCKRANQEHLIQEWKV